MLDVLDGAKATWVGRVRPFAIFFSLFCLQLSTRPAHIPAQEFGRWTTPFSRDSIARLKSTPLCDFHLALAHPVVNLLLFATSTPAPCPHATRLRRHPCSRNWTVLGQGQPYLVHRRAGGLKHPSLLKNLEVGCVGWCEGQRGRGVRLFAIFSSLFCLQLSTWPARIPAQELRAPAPPNPAQEFRLLADPPSHSRTNRN